VSYNVKHNESNGEGNRDGADDNMSWYCGVEGRTDDPAIEALRHCQVKNLLAIQMLAAGTPMLLMGDEARRTQMGNNNAYCQDNDVSWFDWHLVERHADLVRFVSHLIAFRQQRDSGSRIGKQSLSDLLDQAEISWHGVALDQPDWSDSSRSLALTIRPLHRQGVLHAMFNAYWEPLTFALPPRHGVEPWRRWLDTALAAPDDIHPIAHAPAADGPAYIVQARSVVVLAVGVRGSQHGHE
jgi:isoamylase